MKNRNEKSKKQYSIQNQINEDLIPEGNQAEQYEDINFFTEEEIKNFTNYNDNLATLDPLYTQVQPLNRQLLVRVYLKDFNSNGTLATSKEEVLKVMTDSQHEAVYGLLPNPLPFSKKAIVVAALNSEYDQVKQGDIVVLKEKPVIGVSKGKQGHFNIPKAFVHPDHDTFDMGFPLDPNNQHYGYLLIYEQDISVKLK